MSKIPLSAARTPGLSLLMLYVLTALTDPEDSIAASSYHLGCHITQQPDGISFKATFQAAETSTGPGPTTTLTLSYAELTSEDGTARTQFFESIAENNTYVLFSPLEGFKPSYERAALFVAKFVDYFREGPTFVGLGAGIGIDSALIATAMSLLAGPSSAAPAIKELTDPLVLNWNTRHGASDKSSAILGDMAKASYRASDVSEATALLLTKVGGVTSENFMTKLTTVLLTLLP